MADHGVNRLPPALVTLIQASPSVLLAFGEAVLHCNRASNQHEFVQGCTSFSSGGLFERETLAPLATVGELSTARGTYFFIHMPVLGALVSGVAGERWVSEECWKHDPDDVGVRVFESGEKYFVVRAAKAISVGILLVVTGHVEEQARQVSFVRRNVTLKLEATCRRFAQMPVSLQLYSGAENTDLSHSLVPIDTPA